MAVLGSRLNCPGDGDDPPDIENWKQVESAWRALVSAER